MTGERRRSGAEKRSGVGHEFVHSIVDDHTRLAYSELHRDERAATVTAFTARALEFFLERGIVAERLLTDNAFTYVHDRSLRELLRACSIEHCAQRPTRRRPTGRWSATSRRSAASGATA